MEAWEHAFYDRERKQEEYDDAYDYKQDELVGYFDTLGGIADCFMEEEGWTESQAIAEIIEAIPEKYYSEDGDKLYDSELWNLSLDELVEELSPIEAVMVVALEHWLDYFCERYAESC